MLTSSEVVTAYQIILGRHPEGDDVIQHQIRSVGSVEALRDALLMSDEFLGRLKTDSALQRAFRPAAMVLNALRPGTRPAEGGRPRGGLFAAMRA